MLVRLDMRSDRPIYSQISESITDQVADGSLGRGDRLPAARSLAASLDINVHTVLKAYADLERDGVVEVRRGRGGVVVRGETGLAPAVRELVRRAKSQGAARRDLIQMVEEAW